MFSACMAGSQEGSMALGFSAGSNALCATSQGLHFAAVNRDGTDPLYMF